MKNRYIILENEVLMTSFAAQDMPTEHNGKCKVRFTFYAGVEEGEDYPQVKADNLIVALQDYGVIGEDVEYSFSTIFIVGVDYYTEIRID